MKHKLFLVTCILGTSLVFTTSTFATKSKMTEEELSIYADNNILFYDPYGSCVSASADGGVLGGEPDGTQVSFIKTYHDVAVTLSINYGIPWETVMAQGILESASGTSYFARERNNFFGIGAFDSNPDNAFSYATPMEGWEGYYKNIVNTPTYRNHGVFQGETITNPYAYAQAIKNAGYATDPNYVSKLSSLISMIENLSQQEGWKSSKELAEEYPEWYENAAKNAAGGDGSDVGMDEMTTCVVSKKEDTKAEEDQAVTEGKLVSGGMSLAQAQSFMEAYARESDKMQHGTVTFQGVSIEDVGCPSGSLNNCSAFTKWFLNRYTTLGPNGVALIQGSQAVSQNLASHPQLKNGGRTPRMYAIMSSGPVSGSADGWANHTGIVLGIDESKNQIIIGEASCGSGRGSRAYRPRAQAYSLSEYTNSSSPYGPTYAYTDSVLKGI